jgi:exosome complex exonuclease DIS3/RRP44
MDLMESHLFKTPVIVLQTVLEEVRHRSLPLYNRLKALVKMDDKHTWVFYNEFRSCVPRYTNRACLTLTTERLQ